MGKDKEKSKSEGKKKKSKSNSTKSKKKSAGGQQHHKRHHHKTHHQAAKSASPTTKATTKSTTKTASKTKSATTSKTSKSSKKDSVSHNFVMKGKPQPACKDGLLSPSRLQADQMTTIYAIPNEHFKTEEDVCRFNGFELCEQIGKGGFATVFKAKNLSNGEFCAAKTVKIKTQMEVLEMKNELFIMEMVDNPFAVKLYMHFLCNTTLYIFMQLADAGSFGKLLEKEGPFDEANAKFYFAQMCCGVGHMHSCNIAHRDIKPANFLMAEHQNGKKIVLVSDYGLSRVVHKTESGDVVLYGTQCGTPSYMAPEILSGEKYNCYLVDVWSLAVTLFAMLTMQTPFNVDQDDYGVKAMMARQWKWPAQGMKFKVPDNLHAFMKGLLEPDPKKRFTMQKTTTDPWLAADYEAAKNLPAAVSKKHSGSGKK